MLVRDALLPFVVLTSSAKGGHQRQLIWNLRFFTLTPSIIRFLLSPLILTNVLSLSGWGL